MTPHPFYAIFLMASAMFTFAGVNALLRFFEQDYPLTQILAIRFGCSVPLCVLIAGPQLWRARQASLVTYGVRAIATTVSLGCLFTSIYRLPYADATVLMFVATLFMVMLSARLLKEPVGWPQSAAALLGFGGVVVMAGPTGNLDSIGVVCGLISAFLEAVLLLHARKLARHDRSLTTVFTTALFATALTSAPLPWLWVTPTQADALLLLLFGLGGWFGQYLLIAAARYAPAGVLGPVIYSAMIWGVLLSYCVFHEPLSPVFFLGSALIIASGWIVLALQRNKASVA